jgi:hypothetical protein
MDLMDILIRTGTVGYIQHREPTALSTYHRGRLIMRYRIPYCL